MPTGFRSETYHFEVVNPKQGRPQQFGCHDDVFGNAYFYMSGYPERDEISDIKRHPGYCTTRFRSHVKKRLDRFLNFSVRTTDKAPLYCHDGLMS